MRRLVLGAALAACMGTAYAGDLERVDVRGYEANDYTARVFYRLDFGGVAAASQMVGLRLDNARAESRGAPAAFQFSYQDNGAATVKLHGIEVRGPALAAGQEEGGLFGSFGLLQVTGLVMTAVVAGLVVSEGAKKTDTAPVGTGGS